MRSFSHYHLKPIRGAHYGFPLPRLAEYAPTILDCGLAVGRKTAPAFPALPSSMAVVFGVETGRYIGRTKERRIVAHVPVAPAANGAMPVAVVT